MLRFAKTDIARGFVPDNAAGHKGEDTYNRYVGNHYRQAPLTLHDTEMAVPARQSQPGRLNSIRSGYGGS